MKFSRVRLGIPDFLLCPMMILLVAERVRKFAAETEHHPDHMLGDGDAMHAASVGDQDAALAKGGIGELRDSSGRRVNPFQLPRPRKLLRANRISDENLS